MADAFAAGLKLRDLRYASLNSSTGLRFWMMRLPSSNQLEVLKGSRKGQYRHSHQRSVARLLRLDRSGSEEC